MADETATPTYEQIAERHWKTHRPKEYARYSPAERKELFSLLADEVRASVATAESRRKPQDPNETFEQAEARRLTARKMAEDEAIREYLLPPSEADEETDPDLIEQREELRRLTGE